MKTFALWAGGLLATFVLWVVFTNMSMSPEDHARFDVKDVVRAQLRDGDSAEFGDIRTGRDPKGVMVACGTVNAKNGFGAYVGPRRFIRLGNTNVVILEEMGADTFQTFWDESCARLFF